MASFNQQPDPPLLDIYLTVRYTGIKATQYFSKLSPESNEVFRKDLFALRLPYPKMENTTFLLPGLIECHWVGVQPNGLLHKQITVKSKPSKQLLKELSIASITPKFIYPPLPSNYTQYMPSKGNKRPRPDSHIEPSQASASWTPKFNFPIPVEKSLEPGQNVWNDRPHKKAKLGPEDASSSSVSQQSPTFPAFSNLPPLLPRNQGAPNTRVFLPQKPQREPEASQAVLSSSSVGPSPPKDLPKVPQDKATEVAKRPSSDHNNISKASTYSTPKGSQPSVKQEPNDDDSFLLQRKPKQPGQPALEAKQPPVPSQSNTTSPAANASKISEGSGVQKGDLAHVQNFLESLKLSTEIENKSQQMTAVPQTHQESISPSSQDLASQATAIKSASPPSSKISGTSQWYTGSEVPPFRGPRAVETTGSVTSPTTTSTSQRASTAPSTSPSKASAYPPPPAKIETSTSSSSTHTIHPRNNIIDEMGPRRYDRLRPLIAESDKAAASRLQRELFDIKREINANVAREASVIAQLKELNVPSIPDPVKIGHDPSQEMKDDLARLELELAAERKLREEAEFIIADIRREMREPFVVPSLFDAFVKLSRLTTQGLRAAETTDPSKPQSALTEPEPPSTDMVV